MVDEFGRRILRPFIEACLIPAGPMAPTRRLAGEFSGPSLKPVSALVADQRPVGFGRRILRPFIEAPWSRLRFLLL